MVGWPRGRRCPAGAPPSDRARLEEAAQLVATQAELATVDGDVVFPEEGGAVAGAAGRAREAVGGAGVGVARAQLRVLDLDEEAAVGPVGVGEVLLGGADQAVGEADGLAAAVGLFGRDGPDEGVQ